MRIVSYLIILIIFHAKEAFTPSDNSSNRRCRRNSPTELSGAANLLNMNVLAETNCYGTR